MTLLQDMQTMVQGAIQIIQKETATFTRKNKIGYDGVANDLVTTADINAQNHYRNFIEQQYPDDGIIGEEDLNKPSINGQYFTIDPLDGTKAFGRRQSNGVGTMIAHVNAKGEVDAVCIGDINTGELFCYGDELAPTRIRFGIETLLPKHKQRPFTTMYALLREHPEEFPVKIQDLIRKERGGIMDGLYIESGSIGITMAQLWTGEVGILILLPSYETPWDTTPLIGMNRKLDIVHLKFNPETNRFEEINMLAPKMIIKRDYVEVIVRRQHVQELMDWVTL